MNKFKFGFLGAGNMGSALATAVSKAINSKEIVISDASSLKAQVLANELSCGFMDNYSLASSAKFIFLGVKPQVLPTVLKSLEPTLKAREDRFVLITMAAGVKMEMIGEILGKNYPIIRIMPNTPVKVGEGMILYTANDLVFAEEIGEFSDAMKFAGKLDRIDEGLIDAGSALSGCGPAFVYMFAESLADAAVECGLPREKALEYSAQTLLGAAQMMLSTDKHPAELKDAVCSPGGSTIAGVRSLEQNGFRGATISAVKASFERTKELGK